MTSIRTGRHCVFELHVHLVFVAKYRKKIFTQEHIDALRVIAAKVCEDFGAELRELNGEKDHIHLLVNYPPKVAVSSLVNSLKGVTSRLLRKQFPELEKACCNGATAGCGHPHTLQQAVAELRWNGLRNTSGSRIPRIKQMRLLSPP